MSAYYRLTIAPMCFVFAVKVKYGPDKLPHVAATATSTDLSGFHVNDRCLP